MTNLNPWQDSFRRIGRVTLVILKIILLFLEIIRRYLDLS
jgi:hypothetical protein